MPGYFSYPFEDDEATDECGRAMTVLNRVTSAMAWGALAIVGIVMVGLFVGPFIYVGSSVYLVWHRGYGLACDGRVLSEALSPSKQWIARARLVSCGGPAGGQSADVVLVPNVLIPLAVRYTTVLNRNIESNTRRGNAVIALPFIGSMTIRSSCRASLVRPAKASATMSPAMRSAWFSAT